MQHQQKQGKSLCSFSILFKLLVLYINGSILCTFSYQLRAALQVFQSMVGIETVSICYSAFPILATFLSLSHCFQHNLLIMNLYSCRVFMDVSIRIVHKKAVRNDPLLNDFPCFVKIQGNHNHPLDSADALNQLRVQPSTRGVFYKYFEQGNVQ